MKRKDAAIVTLVGLLVLVVEFLAVAALATPAQVEPANAAATIAIITAAAVGIERVLEVFWTAIGLLKDSWWPFGQFQKQLNRLIAELDDVLKQFFARAEASAQSSAQDIGNDVAQPQPISVKVARVRTRTESLRQDLAMIAQDKQQVQLLAASAVNAVSYVERLLPEAQGEAAIAMQAITGVTDFLETFKENPGRRLISIFAGAGIGLLIAWSLGLDVFQAVLAAEATAIQGGTLFPALGVAITGVVIGLGANPTHEVIRLIQEYKKSQKTANSPTPVPVNEDTTNVFRGQPVMLIRKDELAPQGENGRQDHGLVLEHRTQPTRFTSQFRQR
jgi:hypothetical protein